MRDANQLLSVIVSRLVGLDDMSIVKVEEMPKECDDCDTWRARVAEPGTRSLDGSTLTSGQEWSITVRRSV